MRPANAIEMYIYSFVHLTTSIPRQIFLTPPGPLQRPPDLPLTPQPYLESVQISRQEYTRLLLEKMKAPDGSYEDGFLIPGAETAPERPGKGSSNLERNNPLSLHDEVYLYSFYGRLLGLPNETGMCGLLIGD